MHEYFRQLSDFTKDVYDFLDIPMNAKKRKNWRNWDNDSGPEGFLYHYTASNAAVTNDRPLGRIPYMLERFAINSGSPGVHFIVWDCKMPQFEEIRAKYPVFEILDADIFFYGLERAYYHGNSANGFAVGMEIRNVGKLKKVNGKFFWHGGKAPYVGRPPVNVRGVWCEPYTLPQVKAAILMLRWLRNIYEIKPHKVLGHLHITSNRTDPMPHFPLAMIRKACFQDRNVPLDSDHFKWFDEFELQEDRGFFFRYDDWLEKLITEDVDEESLFAREDRPPMGFDDADGIYGNDGIVSAGDLEEAMNALEQIGYYPSGSQEDITWTVKQFQNRWVKKKGNRWVNTMKITGEVDKATIKNLNTMLKQLRFIQ